jgi:hypothetical protein
MQAAITCLPARASSAAERWQRGGQAVGMTIVAGKLRGARSFMVNKEVTDR